MIKDIITLGVETSCDETSVAVVKNGTEVLSNVVASQIEIHKRFLGVVPEVASRNHVMAINNIYERALMDAKITKDEIDVVAVTYGAGLLGALLVGVSFAKALSYAHSIPLVKVNHIKGHIAANYLKSEEVQSQDKEVSQKDLQCGEKRGFAAKGVYKNVHDRAVSSDFCRNQGLFQRPQPPFICLVVSGGHTALLEVLDYTTHKLIGTTVDDACGEAFDKVARILGLEYPGGIYVDNLSKDGNNNIKFPKMLKGKDTFNFSYSGLKTAVINHVNTLKNKNEFINKNDICKSFTVAAIDPLIEKSIRACKKFGYQSLAVAGGVSANSYLRENIVKKGGEVGLKVFLPDLKYCTDNAAMIAAAGYYSYINGADLADLSLNAVSSIPL